MRKRFTLKNKNARLVFKIEKTFWSARKNQRNENSSVEDKCIVSELRFLSTQNYRMLYARAYTPQDLWTNQSINVDWLWKLCYNDAQCLDVS